MTKAGYVPGSNKNYEPIWYDADMMKPISAYVDVQTEKHEKFAWWPIKTNSGTMVWFKNVIVIRKFAKITARNQYLCENIYTVEEYVEMKLKGIVN